MSGICAWCGGSGCHMCSRTETDAVIPFARELTVKLTNGRQTWDTGTMPADIRPLPEDHLEGLRADLENALITMRHEARDGRGLKVFINCGSHSEEIGRSLRELAEMTNGVYLEPDTSAVRSREALARNCLLVTQAYVAACALESYCARYGVGRRVGAQRGDGIVFGHASYND